MTAPGPSAPRRRVAVATGGGHFGAAPALTCAGPQVSRHVAALSAAGMRCGEAAAAGGGFFLLRGILLLLGNGGAPGDGLPASGGRRGGGVGRAGRRLRSPHGSRAPGRRLRGRRSVVRGEAGGGRGCAVPGGAGLWEGELMVGWGANEAPSAGHGGQPPFPHPSFACLAEVQLL